ncbi:MAG: cytochrome b/b6 domain-containing protein, partial [Pseudomonadota bacterium]
APQEETTLSPVQRFASTAGHWGLYALLIAVPLFGYAATSAFPALNVFGLFNLPALVGPDRSLSQLLFEYHHILAMALCGLIAVHASAALYHHFIRRDMVLVRMLPGLLAKAKRTPRKTPEVKSKARV